MQTNDNQLFLEEFGSIDMNPQFSMDVANLPLNRGKNRYNNILPYDHSRVKLSSHKHNTDYINANFMAVSDDVRCDIHTCTCTVGGRVEGRVITSLCVCYTEYAIVKQWIFGRTVLDISFIDNCVQGYMKQKSYIATQGPTPETIGDFWRMVWEHDSRTIVMLTNPCEKGKVKCEVYWPREVGASAMQSNIEITLTDMTQLADYTIRNFTIHKVRH